MNAADEVEREAQHLILFGEPKTGKSTLISKLAEEGYNLLWFSLDNGHTVIKKLSQEAQKRIELVKLPSTKNFPVGIHTMLKVVTGAKLVICDNHGVIDCKTCKAVDDSYWTTVELNSLPLSTIVVIDPINQLAEDAMTVAITRAIAHGDKDATGREEKDPDFFKPGRDQFATQGVLMNKLLLSIQQADWNCICCTHVSETELEDGRKRLVPLIGTAPFSRNSGKFFDHIIYCQLNNKQHSFGSRTTYTISAITGSRTDVSIEDLKDKPSLKPFFTTRISERITEDKKAAVKILQPVIEVVKEKEQLDDNRESIVNSLSIASATSINTASSTSASDAVSRSKELLAKFRAGKL